MSGAESFGSLFKIPELKRRILFTLGVLVVYRIGAHIPTPGIDGAALAELFEQTKGTIMGMFDMFSGGALSRATIFALGIMPYISASIILQLMTIVSPHLAQLKKEGEQGQKKNYTVHPVWHHRYQLGSRYRHERSIRSHEKPQRSSHRARTRLEFPSYGSFDPDCRNGFYHVAW